MKDRLGLYAEVLGAYMEGRLPKGEMSLMNKVLESDKQLGDIINEINSTKVDWSDNIREDYPDFDERFSLPPIPETPIESDPNKGIVGLMAAEI